MIQGTLIPHWGEILRRRAFWTLDHIKGRAVYRNLQEIARLLYTPEEAKFLAQDCLNALLKHSTDNVPYYEEFRGYNNLSDFPIVSKREINTDPSRFMSRVADKDRLHTASTSGQDFVRKD